MSFVDTSSLDVIERLPGWYGRYFHSPSMTFAHYDFRAGVKLWFQMREEAFARGKEKNGSKDPPLHGRR